MENTGPVQTARGKGLSTLRTAGVSGTGSNVLHTTATCVFLLFFCLGKRDIRALAVKCCSAERGCEWEGTVGTLEEHVGKCGFTLVPCPNECKNKRVQQLMRKDLASHLETECPNRDYKCKHCGQEGTYAGITQVHDATCEKKMVPCPNDDCTDTIERQNRQKHLDTCIFTEVACKYQRLGCEVKMKREDIPEHENEDKLHLHMALDTIVTMEADITKALRKKKSFVFRMRDFAKSKEEDTEFHSSAFYTGPHGYHMRIIIYSGGTATGKGTHVSIFGQFLEGKNNKELTWPFVGEITFTLLNQLEDKNHHIATADVTSDKNVKVRHGAFDNWGLPCFISHSDLTRTSSAQYLKDDTLYFKVLVDSPNLNKPWLE